MRNNGSSGLSSVANAMRLLKAFGPAEAELSIVTLSARLGLAKSTIHRLAATLVQAEMLEQNRANSKYRLGLAVFELGSLVRRRMDFYSDAKEELQALRARSGETVNLAVLRGDSVIYLNSLESSSPIKVAAPLGQRIPALGCAEGKVLLAFAQTHRMENEAAESWGAQIPPVAGSVNTPHDLLAEFGEIRESGYAIDNEESVPGICAIAAPFFAGDNEVAGAIGIAGPAQRLNRRKLVALLPLLTEATDNLSRRLGANRPVVRTNATLVSP